MHEITKEFPGVRALDRVSIEVDEGEIHAIVGENGAGKSTLMKVLSGVHPHGSFDGRIVWDGGEYQVKTIKQSEERGIAIIHQEFALSPYLSIAENIFLGNERAVRGVVRWNETKKAAEKLCETVGLNEDVDTAIMDIGVGKQQLVEIVKALSKNIRLLILDEPTAALNEIESHNLLELLKRLRSDGMTGVLISHKLDKVLDVADAITVLRDGATVETLRVGRDEISKQRLIRGMVGRDLTDRFPERSATVGETVFAVRDWTVHHPQIPGKVVIDNVAIELRRGEVVGLAGLMGAGRTEFAMSVFGRSYGTDIRGEVFVHGRPVDVRTVQRAIGAGIAYISEDRKTLGLVLENSLKNNVTLANLDDVSENQIIDENREIIVSERAVDAFKIKCSSIQQHVVNLSGGNQQKVVLAKWLFCDSDVYIMDEPTRGIDVGAKLDVYNVINDLAEKGKTILFISSELPEILGMSDRIYVMNKGRIVKEFQRGEATQEDMLSLMI
jgi:putative multiple sugar transport system ATP-binding protein